MVGLTGESRLCMAGGVALNCVANGKIIANCLFDEIWVQPAAGDAGGALGAALAVAVDRGAERDHGGTGLDAMSGSLLGPAYSDDQIAAYLTAGGIPHRRLEPAEMAADVAKAIAAGKVVGWFQGRMEFGPRALGARSILGDPRDPQTQSVMNLKIKFRESFRPFAPSVLADDAKDFFDLPQDSPYMLVVAPVAEAARLAVETDSGVTGLEHHVGVHEPTGGVDVLDGLLHAEDHGCTEERELSRLGQDGAEGQGAVTLPGHLDRLARGLRRRLRCHRLGLSSRSAGRLRRFCLFTAATGSG